VQQKRSYELSNLKLTCAISSAALLLPPDQHHISEVATGRFRDQVNNIAENCITDHVHTQCK